MKRIVLRASCFAVKSSRNQLILNSSNQTYRFMSTSNKKSALYTRTGDKGETSLYNLQRKPKDDQIFAALGNVDELNAHIGLAREYCEQANNGLTDKLEVIQSRLLDIGSCIATPIDSSSEQKLARVRFDEAHVQQLEQWIDEIDGQLPKLTNFILPSGGFAASQLHIARTVCRRAERSVVQLIRDGTTDEIVMKYLNRLSDLFFACARFAAQFEKKEVVVWRK